MASSISLVHRSCGAVFFGLLSALLVAGRPASAETLAVGPGEAITTVEEGLAAAVAGDTVLVRAGTYRASRLRPSAGVALVGEEGPLQTRLHAADGEQAIIVEGATDVRIDGFDIYAEPGVGPSANALVHLEDSASVLIRDCFLHDAPVDGDVVKVIGTEDLTIESCAIWNPSERVSSPGTFQECIDIRGHGDARITVRGCWLFHLGDQGDYLLYAKGGTTDLLWEGNVFGPSAGNGWGNVPVETGHLVQSDPTEYESERFVVRNNLFVGLRGSAAFAFAGPRVAVLHNNVFFANGEVSRGIIELTGNPALAGGPALEIFSLNNIFFQNGALPIYRVRDEESGDNLVRDHNVYETGTTGGGLDLASESSSLFVADPLFAAPAMVEFDPARGTEQIREALEGFATLAASPTGGGGVDVWDVAGEVHPTAIEAMSSRVDAFGNDRPAGSPWDPGLGQLPAADGDADGDTDVDGDVDADGDTDVDADGDTDADDPQPGDGAPEADADGDAGGAGGGSSGCGCRAAAATPSLLGTLWALLP